MNSFILCLRALRNLRGFIHINLCTNLGIAQVIFIAGVDKTGGSSDHVPPHCKMVAVLLHYFFLATFMWMLMEGIFLYLTVVKVFLFKTKRYLMLFTVLSYGFPLLYMSLLSLPLGFGLRGDSNYGYQQAYVVMNSNIVVSELLSRCKSITVTL